MKRKDEAFFTRAGASYSYESVLALLHSISANIYKEYFDQKAFHLICSSVFAQFKPVELLDGAKLKPATVKASCRGWLTAHAHSPRAFKHTNEAALRSFHFMHKPVGPATSPTAKAVFRARARPPSSHLCSRRCTTAPPPASSACSSSFPSFPPAFFSSLLVFFPLSFVRTLMWVMAMLVVLQGLQAVPRPARRRPT